MWFSGTTNQETTPLHKRHKASKTWFERFDKPLLSHEHVAKCGLVKTIAYSQSLCVMA
jgi:hypothetical protein